ncbi:MAG: type II toxin-antitoxin system VapC family toxin [Chloroflexota bacterium]
MVIDSNLIIYSAQPHHSELREFIKKETPNVFGISYVEVLGYHSLNDEQKVYFETFFKNTIILPVSREILDEAVALKQKRKISLGDSIIAGTCLVYGFRLATRNLSDFEWIDGLDVFNPYPPHLS